MGEYLAATLGRRRIFALPPYIFFRDLAAHQSLHESAAQFM